jgi:1-deoxy-D-xylulose-5-phosphate synthase
VLLFALGSMVATAERVHEQLSEQGVETTLVNARFAKPLDEHYLLEKMASYDLIVTLEENVITGGFGEQIETLLVDHGYTGRVMKVAVPDQFVEHGNVEVLKQMLGMDADSITEAIKKQLQDGVV